jgi:putative spermidine/putrescine transport system ATP-binding protein
VPKGTLTSRFSTSTGTEPAAAGGLRLRDLHKTYGGGTYAVDELNLDVSPGEFVTFLGPSGSGKTSTLRMIAGFETPTKGEVELDGRAISRLSPAERGFGMVFQDYALFPHMTVAQNVAYGPRIRGVRGAERKRIVDEMLELVQLQGMGQRYPAQLSGGQQQRVSMARAIAFGPRLLLMDEPLGALDRQLRLQMEAELRRIHRELGTTILYVTHDQDEALALSDRIAIMRDGRLIEYDTARTIFERPRTVFAAQFVSRCNVYKGVLRRNGGQSTLELLGKEVPLPATGAFETGPVSVGIRRDAFRLGGSAGLTFDVVVEGIVYRGEYFDAVCRLPNGEALNARFLFGDGSGVSIDSRVSLAVNPEDLHLLVDDLAGSAVR